MWEYYCRNSITGKEESYFGYSFADATKNCEHPEALTILFQDYID